MEDVKESIPSRIKWPVEMELRSGSMEVMSPLYIARMLNVPIEDVEECLKKMRV